MDTLSLISRYETVLKERKIPKMQFYKDCNISDATVSQWRSGKHLPSMTALSRISDYLSVSIEWLLTGIDPQDIEKDFAEEGGEDSKTMLPFQKRSLYETIISLCAERGIKGARMCADLGISKSLMTDLKSGRRQGFSAVTAQKIASYFGVTVGCLLGEESPSAETPITSSDLSEEEINLVMWYREKATQREKIILRVIVEIDSNRNG